MIFSHSLGRAAATAVLLSLTATGCLSSGDAPEPTPTPTLAVPSAPAASPSAKTVPTVEFAGLVLGDGLDPVRTVTRSKTEHGDTVAGAWRLLVDGVPVTGASVQDAAAWVSTFAASDPTSGLVWTVESTGSGARAVARTDRAMSVPTDPNSASPADDESAATVMRRIYTVEAAVLPGGGMEVFAMRTTTRVPAASAGVGVTAQ